MKRYTQKWVIVTLLEPVEEGFEFNYKDWPLHVTLAPPFSLDWDNSDAFEKLTDLLAKRAPVELTAEVELQWDETKVVAMNKSPEIMALHQNIVDVLIDAGAVFNNPEYIGENFTPHCTVQQHARVQIGDTVKITDTTIVDMFVGGDWQQRKVLRSIKLEK